MLSLNRHACRVDGCGKDGEVFGVCREHQAEQVSLAFEEHVRNGEARAVPPPCFESQSQWEEYVVAWHLANAARRASLLRKARVDYCRDCSPEFRRRMLEKNRCTHPETVFVQSSRMQDVVGVRVDWEARSYYPWQTAMMGASGPIVSMPQESVISQTLERMNSAPRRGRPPKKAG